MPQKNKPYPGCAYTESGCDCFGRYATEDVKTRYCHVLTEMPKGASANGRCPFYKAHGKERSKK